MKMIIAIIQDKDSFVLIDELTKKDYRVTKLSSTGGFLREGNTTLLMGVEKEKVQDLLHIIEENCKERNVITSMPNLAMPGKAVIPYPLEVKVGGANVFIFDVERHIRI